MPDLHEYLCMRSSILHECDYGTSTILMAGAYLNSGFDNHSISIEYARTKAKEGLSDLLQSFCAKNVEYA